MKVFANINTSQSQFLSIVNFLLENGCDLEERDFLGSSALFYAIESHKSGRNNFELINYLINKGAKVTVPNIQGKLPIDLVFERKTVENQDKELAKLLNQKSGSPFENEIIEIKFTEKLVKRFKI